MADSGLDGDGTNGTPNPAQTIDRIVIGASAGGVEALRTLVSGLPADLPAAVLVVVHILPQAKTLLPQILSRSGPLPAAHAEDGGSIQAGRIYIAPPDYHLLVEADSAGDRTRLSHGARENYTRPAIDVLFRSAATVYGSRVVGVVLSGMLYDGTAGMIAIKRAGGIGIVQEPTEARFDSMPVSAISKDHPDGVLPLAEITTTLMRLAHGSSPRGEGTDPSPSSGRTLYAGHP